MRISFALALSVIALEAVAVNLTGLHANEVEAADLPSDLAETLVEADTDASAVQ